MKPFFPYFGSKYRIARRYGAPRYDGVIEPFAGSACYSVYWEPKHVILMDHNPVIYEAWTWLIQASPAEVLALPIEFESTDDLDIPPGAKHVIGFWLNKGGNHPNKKPGSWAQKYRKDQQCRIWSESARARIAGQVHKIRHWEVFNADYTAAPDWPCHWFIDPPYHTMGHRYRRGKPDFVPLALWARSRPGFVQVCENVGAEWLPFRPFVEVRGTKKNSFEAIWEQGS